MKRLFLLLLTIFALTFPGMSVCATEQQTESADTGDSGAISQEELDLFSNTGIYYYNPDYDDDTTSEEVITGMQNLIVSQNEQIQLMEQIIQEKDEQIAIMQQGVDRLGPVIAILTIIIIGLVIYQCYIWRTVHRSNSKIVDFRRRT